MSIEFYREARKLAEESIVAPGLMRVSDPSLIIDGQVSRREVGIYGRCSQVQRYADDHTDLLDQDVLQEI